jgi:inhibitor of cysteine peptidase
VETRWSPVTGTFAPEAGDDKLVRGEAFVEIPDSQVVLLESYPVQVQVNLQGSLPNPCHQLRVNPSQPDSQNRIQIEVYSVTKPDTMCTEVLKPFNVQFPLGNLSTGHYLIYINGELLAEFDV